MAEEGHDTRPPTLTTRVVPPVTEPPSRKHTTVDKLAKLAMVKNHIGKDVIYEARHPRYISLQRNEMYASLVTFYSTQFRFMKDQYSVLAEHFSMINKAKPWETFARVYISHWFLDLYTSNREALTRHESVDFHHYYERQTTYYSTVYDNFLQILNASIRPTHLKGCFGDTLYIPIIYDQSSWINKENPFNISNFRMDKELFRAIIGKMKEPTSGWKTSTLVTDALGRPSWLFDWHTGHNVGAWFPEEGNYNMTDVSIAYLVGVACTPLLASADYDDWSTVPANTQKDLHVSFYPRVREATFFGAYEVSTIRFRDFPITTLVPLDVHNLAKEVYEKRYNQHVEDYQRELASRQERAEEHRRRLQVEPTPQQQSTLAIQATRPQTQQTGATTGQPSHDAQLSLVPLPTAPTAMPLPPSPLPVSATFLQYQVVTYKYYKRVIKRFDEATRTGAHRILALGLPA